MEPELNEWMDRWHNIVGGDDGVEESKYMYWYLKITRKFVGRPTPASLLLKTVRFRTQKNRTSAGLRDIACIANTFSTKGLNPQQIESSTRIRDTALYCLGDQIGDAIKVSTTPHIEDGKKLEESWRMMRKTNGKRRWKDDFVNCHMASEDDQSQFCSATIDDCEVDHLLIEPGKRVRKKQRVRRKPVGKHKKDDTTRCNATSRDDQPQFRCADKVDHIQLCCAEVDSQPQPADDKISDPQLFHDTSDDTSTKQCPGDGKIYQSLPCKSSSGGDAELYFAANDISEGVSLLQSHVDRKVGISEPCQAVDEGDDAQLCFAPDKADEGVNMQQYHADSRIDQLLPNQASGDGSWL